MKVDGGGGRRPDSSDPKDVIEMGMGQPDRPNASAVPGGRSEELLGLLPRVDQDSVR